MCLASSLTCSLRGLAIDLNRGPCRLSIISTSDSPYSLQVLRRRCSHGGLKPAQTRLVQDSRLPAVVVANHFLFCVLGRNVKSMVLVRSRRTWKPPTPRNLRMQTRQFCRQTEGGVSVLYDGSLRGSSSPVSRPNIESDVARMWNPNGANGLALNQN